MHVHGELDILDNVFQGTSTYFLVIFTGRLIILFEVFALASDCPVPSPPPLRGTVRNRYNFFQQGKLPSCILRHG